MAVVAEWTQGNAKIFICDDAYRDKTQEDIDRILRRVAQIAWKAAQAEEAKKETQTV